jgi:DNA-binding XRE family transcriptional regulator
MKITGIKHIASYLGMTANNLSYHMRQGNIKLRRKGYYYWSTSGYLDQWKVFPYTGSELRAARIRQGLSQIEVAEQLRVSSVTVGYWESDTNWPTRKRWAKLFKILKLR